VKELRNRGVEIPLVLMGYYNPMLAYGLEKFVHDAMEAGVDGFIVPDLPMEESDEFESVLNAGRVDGGDLPPSYRGQGSAVEAHLYDVNRVSTADFATNAQSSAQRERLPLIPMLAPTSSPERMEMIARNAKGFIYLVSVTGITGERKSLAEGLGDLIARVREHTAAAVCVGFGIGTPDQAKEVGKMADGVIVGTACVRVIGESKTPVETAREFAKSFSNVLR